jgi:choline dehydrogenase-like flavoprotein
MIVQRSLDVSKNLYDVVIVGAGMCAAILAMELDKAGKKVLILEAGTGQALTWDGYQSNLLTFYMAEAKTPDSPYPFNPDAPRPDVLDATQITPGNPDTKGYFVQVGPQPFRSTYPRTGGGTMLHWMGTCLRMLPDDFKLKTLFHRGRDWPFTYEEMMPYYARAEREIGVSANVEEQAYLGVHFEPGYVFPMHRVPPSYLDRALSKGLSGMTIEFDRESYPVEVVSTPEGRNSMPNPAYDGGKGYEPVGAVGAPDIGQRCEGSTNCVPICPIQAKYNPLKTLSRTKDNVVLVTQAVASKIITDRASGRVTGIEYKAYKDPNSPHYETHMARGTLYVLAAHSIENAKLMLASGLRGTSDQVGRNLMDHPVMLTWGLMPQRVFCFRGPLSTSGIESMRTGSFRGRRAAFRIEIGNEGWNWAAMAPYADVNTLVDQKNVFGVELRRRLNADVPRQFRFGFLFEQLPDENNRVTIDPKYKDPLGNYRPVIEYHVSDYIREAMVDARQVSSLIFRRLGVEDFTNYSTSDPGYVSYRGQGYVYQGAGHLCGTHQMGTQKSDSAVDPRQRFWDSPNLYLTGCGNFPRVWTTPGATSYLMQP